MIPVIKSLIQDVLGQLILFWKISVVRLCPYNICNYSYKSNLHFTLFLVCDKRVANLTNMKEFGKLMKVLKNIALGIAYGVH